MKTKVYAAVLATATVVAGCTAAQPNRAPASGDSDKTAAAKPDTAKWRTTNIQLVAGAGNCAEELDVTITFDGDQVSAVVDHANGQTRVVGSEDDNGELVLNPADGAENQVRVMGFADRAARQGQLNVTTYGPVCSYRVDIAPASGAQVVDAD